MLELRWANKMLVSGSQITHDLANGDEMVQSKTSVWGWGWVYIENLRLE